MGAVHGGTVLARNPAVLWTSLDGEVVLYDSTSSDVLLLNPTAGVLWECLDGVSELREILADIASAYGVDDEVIAADCLPVLDSWLSDGLAIDPSAPAPPPPLPEPETAGAQRGSDTWAFLTDPPNA